MIHAETALWLPLLECEFYLPTAERNSGWSLVENGENYVEIETHP